MSCLSIRDLWLTYPGDVQALRGIDLDISVGMFGLLGPNGAGKSTLMRILATLQEPDSGTARLGELDLLTRRQQTREILGYLPQEFGFHPSWKARRLLDHLALLKGLHVRAERREVVDGLLRHVNLWDVAERRVGSFSGGMKQRLGIAQALIGQPRLVIVDEPTAGLDPAERRRFHDLLAEVSERTVVILSTHIVEDVRDLCTSMAVIAEGRILLSGEPRREVAALDGKVWEATVEKAEVESLHDRVDLLSTRLHAGETLARVFSESSPGQGFRVVAPSLEDVYFRVLGVEARAHA